MQHLLHKNEDSTFYSVWQHGLRLFFTQFHVTKLKMHNWSKVMSQQHGFKRTISSVLAAFVGVQSNKNREQDFQQGNFHHFVIAGIIGVILFVGLLIAIVSSVIPG